MGKIFCLMGKSCSGKDTIFKLLRNDYELNLKPVVSYTTRPVRENETNGIEYFFIKEEELLAFENAGKVIEKREYNTVNGIWRYCTIDDGQIDLIKANYLLISTLQAYEKLQNYFKAENVVPIYVEIEDGIRLERALAREKQQKSPNYNEVCRRFLADNKDFSDEKLEEFGIIKGYSNLDINTCIANIKEELIKLIGG